MGLPKLSFGTFAGRGTGDRSLLSAGEYELTELRTGVITLGSLRILGELGSMIGVSARGGREWRSQSLLKVSTEG